MYLRNAIKTPDGTILESEDENKVVWHTDLNGKDYFVSGGHKRIARSLNGDEEPMDLTLLDNFSSIREHFSWKTRNELTNSEEFSYVKLKDLTTPQVRAIINVYTGEIHNSLITVLLAELGWRALNDVK